VLAGAAIAAFFPAAAPAAYLGYASAARGSIVGEVRRETGEVRCVVASSHDPGAQACL